ncbi:MAG: tetratricopeptide repeat-containing sulfotransferase family protein [Gammaproteobacteria bacterium]|nr:MAG: tetratricopeptide repeat-containing sulfotransferase family protein [Gammaproteobacteria bacterium]
MNERQIAKIWERGMAAEQSEDWTEAKRLYRKVTDAVPRHAPTFQRLGLIALREGRPEDAVDNFQRSLSIEPADPVCLNNLGNVLRELGRLPASVSAYRQALGRQPDYPSALYNLAGTLALLGEHSQAVGVYRDLLRLVPGDVEAWNALGLSLLEIGEGAESIKALEEALRLEPNDAELLNELGVAHQFEGDLEAAGRLYLASIESDPGFPRAYDNLVRSRRMKSDDLALVEPIEKIAGDASRDDASRLIARFALGKIYDDCADYDKAFENYAVGNALKHRMVDFDAAEHSAWVGRVLAKYDEEFFRVHSGEGNPSTRPVFVLGMIRSGTSLVEQILASHSRIYGAGELLEITKLVTDLPATLDANAIRAAASEYLQRLATRDDRALRVVDKLPTNFLHLGFIAALLPNARVVHCQRGPLDVCLSIYFQRFAQGHFYAYDFDDIAAYYAEYERLMGHWKNVLPIEILDVQYEQLLDDLEGESRRMLDYCELDWQSVCLEFHRNKRPVRTASSWQVRQPLYRTAKARWRKFEPHLDGLKKALSDRAIRWDSAG